MQLQFVWISYVRLNGDAKLPISSSRDVYRILVEEDEETSWLFGLVAFAVIEERRIEWMQHFEEQNGKVPTADEIQDWYEQQPDGTLQRATGDAENILQAYAQELEEEIIESERRVIENEVIVSEIRSLRRPWANFGINVAAGLLSALLFAAVLTILAFIVFADSSPINFGKWIGNKENGMIENGKKTDQ